ncbi:MAG: phosphomethylpyrimidine synthase ThiC, partial [Armatimonadota bacterium]
EEVRQVADAESVPVAVVLDGLRRGTIVIPRNAASSGVTPMGIGAGLRTKVNANLGTSLDFDSTEEELTKLRAALDAGADTVMDLSTGTDIDGTRRAIRAACDVPLGTVPIYQAGIEAMRAGDNVDDMTEESMFDVIERHAADGVDFVTLHCGVTRESVGRLRRQGRTCDIVSRGGAFHARWMVAHDRENPLYEHFDRVLDIAARYDVTLSLGDGLRPGALTDATDRAQVQETIVLGELVDAARAAGVQVIIEGPGHVPMDQIAANVTLQKRLCGGAPFYVLGPLVTDVAPGYDHIVGAIGGAICAAAGADFICYVTPTEHIGLPTPKDVAEGVIASRIAAHAADIANGIPSAIEWDNEMSRARRALDWDKQAEVCIDPKRFAALRRARASASPDTCSMCGDYCPMRDEWLTPAEESGAPPAHRTASVGAESER